MADAGLIESGRTLALETVVQWLVFQVVQGAAQPRVALDELLSHIDQQKGLVSEAALAQSANGAPAEWAEAQIALAGLDELRESIATAVEVSD